MSSLVRAGVVLAVLGLCLATFWAVAFGAFVGSAAGAGTDCADGRRDYSLAGVDPDTGSVAVDDGCTVHVVAGPVVLGAVGAVAGCLVGGAGLISRAVARRTAAAASRVGAPRHFRYY